MRNFIRGVAIALVLALCAASAGAAQEGELKAAILFKLLLFLDWPAYALPTEQRLVICVADFDAVAEALVQLQGQIVHGRQIEVRRWQADPAGACQVVYVTAAQDRSRWLRPGQLLVAGAGGPAMIALDVDAGRVVFDVDLAAMRRAGIGVSAKVLRLARRVREQP